MGHRLSTRIYEIYMTTLLPAPNEWQIKDEGGMIMPYFTHPFLEVLRGWNISDMDLFEWGAGFSTLWFSRRCRSITAVEHTEYWAKSLRVLAVTMNERGAGNHTRAVFPAIVHIPTPSDNINHGGIAQEYCSYIDTYDRKYDIIIIDGIYRNQCVIKALQHIKKGGIIIFDNWKQKSCDIDVSSIEHLLEPYEHYSFPQLCHADWITDYWIIN